MRYIPSLDGLRALAVGLVLLAHMPVLEGSWLAEQLARAASGLRLGYLGVDIFFVLSGFLVTRILVADKSAGRYSFGRFYLKRALRLFPVFYLCIAICAITIGLPRAELFANLLYLSNYYYVIEWHPSPLRHTWSLSVEEQFYLVWPVLIALASRATLPRLLMFGIPLVVGLSLWLAYLYVPETHFGRLVNRGMTFRVLSLGAGALLALHAERLPSIGLRWIGLVGLIGILGHLASLTVDDYARATIGLFSMTALSVSIFLFVYVGASRGLPLVKGVFENPAAIYIGRISYGIYLYHFIILYALGGREEGHNSAVPLLTLLSFLGLSLAIPALSYRFLERPILDIKDRLNDRGEDNGSRV